MWRRLGQERKLAIALHTLAGMHLHQGELATAETLLDEAFHLAGTSGDEEYLLLALADFAILRHAQREYHASLELNERLLALAEQHGKPYYTRMARLNTAQSLCRLGRFEEAQALMGSLIATELELDEPISLAELAEALLGMLAEVGHHSEAVTLLGAADRQRRRLGAPRLPIEEEELDAFRARAHTALTDAEWSEAYEAGAASPLEGLLAALPGERVEPVHAAGP